MTFRTTVVLTLTFAFQSSIAAAGVESDTPTPAPAVEPSPLEATRARGPAFELNVLWPFFPGGISELKLLVPVVRSAETDGRGELVLGLHSDFATRFVRPDERYGKVSFLGAKVGYRQFLVAGLHAVITVNSGWRHEEHNVWDGGTLDAFSTRLWLMAGFERDFGERVYANVRGGLGIHLLRTDRWAALSDTPLRSDSGPACPSEYRLTRG